MNKTNEKKCGNCSRRKFYQVGYKDGFNNGYKHGCEVEKFISFYDGLPETRTLNGQQLLDDLKECLKRNE